MDYSRFTDLARKVMLLANQEAQRFNHEYIGTEHILLGLVKEGSGVAATVLKGLGIDLRKIRLEVERIVQAGDGIVTMNKLPVTPGARRSLELAIESMAEFGHKYVGTEHVLLGLIRNEKSVAKTILEGIGVTAEAVEKQIKELLLQPPVAKPRGPWTDEDYTALRTWVLFASVCSKDDPLVGLVTGALDELDRLYDLECSGCGRSITLLTTCGQCLSAADSLASERESCAKLAEEFGRAGKSVAESIRRR